MMEVIDPKDVWRAIDELNTFSGRPRLEDYDNEITEEIMKEYLQGLIKLLMM